MNMMGDQIESFREIVSEISKAEVLRDTARLRALDEFEANYSTLARVAIANLGSRERAARWMCIKQKRLAGRCVYEALAEGDLDDVWDLIVGN